MSGIQTGKHILTQALQVLRREDPFLSSLPSSLDELKGALSNSDASALLTRLEAAFSNEEAYSKAFDAFRADFSSAVGDQTSPHATTLAAQKNAWVESGRPVVEDWVAGTHPSRVGDSRKAKVLAHRAATFVPGATLVNRRIKLSDGSTAHINVAKFKDPAMKGDWGAGEFPFVNISSSLDPNIMEQQLARLIGELSAHIEGGDKQTAGLRAQFLVQIDQFFTMSPTERSQHAADIDRALAGPELQALLHSGDDPTLEMLVDKYVFTRDVFEPTDTGASSGVRLYGNPTTKDTNGAIRDPGHIMATDMDGSDAVGEHFSFGPVVASNPSSAQRATSLEQGGVSTKGTPVLHDREIAFFRGARPAPLSIRKGMLYDYTTDGYVQHDHAWSFGFDPDFLPPEPFNALVSMEKALEESDPASRDYVLATTQVEKGRVEIQDVVKGPIQMLLTQQHKRGGLVKVSEEEDKLVSHAHNCVTTLIALLRNVKDAQGKPVLDATDLEMMGLDAMGRAPAGRDLRPQDLFLHLRWKEAAWKQTHH